MPTSARSVYLASVSFTNATYTVNGAGTDLWGTADAFHFVYRSLTGNGTVVARLASVTKPADSAWAMGAIIMRDGIGANARHVAMMVTTDGEGEVPSADDAGGDDAERRTVGGNDPTPRWLKLTRVGDVFTAYISSGRRELDAGGSTATLALRQPLRSVC